MCTYYNFQTCYRKHTIFFLLGLFKLSFYYIPINDTTFELSVFWLSDTESQINEVRFSDAVSLSFKTRLTSVTRFWGYVILSFFQAWNQGLKNMMT